MTTDPSMSRRVTRLEHDTESIYDLITGVRTTQDEHTRRFDRVEGSLHEVESTLAEVGSTLGEVESTLAEVVRRLPEPS